MVVKRLFFVLFMGGCVGFGRFVLVIGGLCIGDDDREEGLGGLGGGGGGFGGGGVVVRSLVEGWWGGVGYVETVEVGNGGCVGIWRGLMKVVCVEGIMGGGGGGGGFEGL